MKWVGLWSNYKSTLTKINKNKSAITKSLVTEWTFAARKPSQAHTHKQDTNTAAFNQLIENGTYLKNMSPQKKSCLLFFNPRSTK